MKYLLKYLLVSVLLVSIGLAQTNPDPRMAKAQELETNKDFEAAFELYEKIHNDSPENNALTFKLAGMAYQMEDFKLSAKYYEKLAPNGNPTVLYNLSCSLARAGKERKAIKYLQQAVEKGFNQVSLMRTDPDLESIRDNKKFEEIVMSAKSIENIPEAQKFDFWVGEWNVYNPQQNKVGESRIEKILKNGVILENWSGASGFEGKSFNHYHIESGKWIQYWVDQSSSRIYFEGNFDPEQNAIVFYEKPETADKPWRRLTFFNISPDSVRQFSQLSSDNKETWTVEYDFMYVRK